MAVVADNMHSTRSTSAAQQSPSILLAGLVRAQIADHSSSMFLLFFPNLPWYFREPPAPKGDADEQQTPNAMSLVDVAIAEPDVSRCGTMPASSSSAVVNDPEGVMKMQKKSRFTQLI